jgi:uncharacterized protein (DUF302 family)
MSYGIRTIVDEPFERTLEATRSALADQGFGVLAEIDLAGTLRAKIGAGIAPQVILGACRPPLAYAAVQAEPSIGLLLPCNVVVRAGEAGKTVVEALDPSIMVAVTRNETLSDIAAEAGARLTAALASLNGTLTA